MTRKGLWPTLERLPSLEAVLVEWRNALGQDFTDAEPFLIPTNRHSPIYPCTNKSPCGCYHEVIEHPSGRIVAACRCDTRECKTIPLQAKDTFIYALDSQKFSKAIRDALNFTPNGITSSTTAQNRWLVGIHSEAHSPVYFLTRNSEENFLQGLEELVNTEPAPFILLAPSNQFKTPTVQAVLQKHRSVLVPLSSALSLKNSGKFAVRQSIQPILDQFKQGLPNHREPVKTKSHYKEKILYEVTFNAMRGEILLNGKTRLSKPNLGSENEAVIQYLIANPNKKITKKDIESKMETKIGKDFHKIVENLGFTGNLRKTFFKTSASHIIFRNPITENAFKELGIPALKVKK